APVTLPPGRFRLATKPSLIGSSPIVKTIGMVVVAAFAASAAGVVVAAITPFRQNENCCCASDGCGEYYEGVGNGSVSSAWPHRASDWRGRTSQFHHTNQMVR